MGFQINTNVGALNAYNSLAKVNSLTERAQLRLATQKKINNSADDTSGFNVGKKLESANMKAKAQLNNAASASNYLSTAETALQQINDKFNQIAAKYTDSKDNLKDKTSIANDIRTIASEIDSILKNTKINGNQLLASTDGSTLTNAASFDIGGSSFSIDFAGSSFLNSDSIKSKLHGNTTLDGVDNLHSVFNSFSPYNGGLQTSVIKITYDDNTTQTFDAAVTSTATNFYDILMAMGSGLNAIYASGGPDFSWINIGPNSFFDVTPSNGKKIAGFETVSGYDMTTALGLTMHPSGGGTTAGLMDSNADNVLSAASDISSITSSVRSALGRIGNLTQTVSSRSEYLTSTIANNNATISNIFDADMALEQLNATKGSISGQVATSMLAQMNSAPQQLMSLFR